MISFRQWCLTSEIQFLTTIFGIEGSLIIYKVTVAEGLLHLPLVFVSLHRAPLALALYNLLGYLPWRLWFNDDDISLISLAKEASLTYLEELGRLMSHQFYHPFDGEHALIYQLEHGNERELNHRHA